MKLAIELWVCDECHAYYASSSIAGRDLTTEPNYQGDMVRKVGDVPFGTIMNYKAKCPSGCIKDGEPVNRRKVLAQVDITPQTVLQPVA